MTECMILLEARYPARNVFRSYYVAAQYDLFERLMVEVVRGRIGAKGKRSSFFVADQEEAVLLISTFLKRRESAVKRIGVPYFLRYFKSHWDLDEALFPFRQNPLFDEPYPMPDKKLPEVREIIREGEGLFGKRD